MARTTLEVRQVPGGFYAEDMAGGQGNRYYVNSAAAGAGATSGYGASPDSPFSTLSAAFSTDVLASGDIVYIAAGHTESVAAADIAMDIAGIKVIGAGQGANRPTFTLTEVGSTIAMSAASCQLENVLITVSADATAAVTVTGADCTMKNVELRFGSAKEFVTGVDVGGARCRMIGCTVDSTATTGCSQGIYLNTVVDGAEISDCLIKGEFSGAAIHNPTSRVLTNLLLKGNLVSNVTTGIHAIELISACTGLAIDNKMYGDTLGTIFDPGSMKCIGNMETDAIDQAGVPSPATSAGSLPANSIGAATFAAGAIDATAIANGAIDAATFAASAIDATAIASNAIAAAKIAADALTSAKADPTFTTQVGWGETASAGPQALPQNGTKKLFTVAGGKVLIKSIVGQVTSIIQSQACSTKIVGNPTTGTDVDLCAVGGISSREAGALFTITGTLANALQISNAGASSLQDRGVVVNTGTIDLNTNASNTGNVKWIIHYVPIDAGATITDGSTS